MNPEENQRWIELRHWRQFLAVAEELHFGRAAARLHMTQPPLTQAIAGLEQTLGASLFDRTRRRVALTPAGAALLPEVRELLARARALPPLARGAARGELGRIRLAFVSTAGFELLPRWVRAWREQAPGVHLELIEATSDVQAELLERGEIDAGLMLLASGSPSPGLAHWRVAVEPLVLALPEQHALAQGSRWTLAQVLAEPLVIFPRRIASSLHDAVFALYHAGGRAPQVAQEAIQMQTIVNLVSAGLGLAWVPQSVERFQRAGVVYRPAPGHGARRVPACETRLVWSTERVSPVLARFLDFVGASAERAQSDAC
jgi:DNA-binding transcriptional LysR family regulator